eukprot:XP_003723486.1 PREDICTED: alpha-N-acetylgalactosamine-specific lectin isoform X2 [Strongylocentrotus purpuratus]
MKALCIFLLCAATSYTYGNTPNEYACPHAWTQRNGYCYRYFDDMLPWSIAESRCHEHFDSDGIAHLVSIHDQAENDFIFDIFNSANGDHGDLDNTNTPGTDLPTGMWTGLHQEVRDGPWVWSDGSSNDYTHWLPGQPDNGYHARGRLNEDCVIIWRNDDNGSESTRQWDDIGCDIQGGMPYVCKMPAVPEFNDVEDSRHHQRIL